MLTSSLIKKIKSLKDKKERIAHRLFIAEGEKSVVELMNSSFEIEAIYAVEGWTNQPAFSAAKKNIEKIILITAKELSRISLLEHPNKVLALVHLPFHQWRDTDFFSAPILAFENISDPGNLGSIIRIADWFGIENIVCSPSSVDAFNPKVVQATMGSIFRTKIFYTNLEEFLAYVKQKKVMRIYAATLAGNSIYSTEKKEGGVLLFGNESKGLSEPLLKLADMEITIPSFKSGNFDDPTAESLNIAMATAIVCNEWRRK